MRKTTPYGGGGKQGVNVGDPRDRTGRRERKRRGSRHQKDVDPRGGGT